ncbi:MAG: D-alanine--D-alanine ligase family protein, partial [Treponemataceae bacterium]
MKVAIIFGGKSSEHEVSLRSASSVVRHIDTQKHEIILIGINKQGMWFLQSDSEIERIKSDENAILNLVDSKNHLVLLPAGGQTSSFVLLDNKEFLKVDVVFPVLHGTFGEDGTIQGLFEMLDLPYVGAGVMASAVAMDKEKTKQIWLQEKLPVVPFLTIHESSCVLENSFAAELEKITQTFSFPVFIKPCCAGSSVGAKKAENKKELIDAI